MSGIEPDAGTGSRVNAEATLGLVPVPGDPRVELYELVLQIPSLLGRLIYIASLWNLQMSRYDAGLPERLRFPGADNALAKWHQTFFLEWLALSLKRKRPMLRSTGEALGAAGIRFERSVKRGRQQSRRSSVRKSECTSFRT